MIVARVFVNDENYCEDDAEMALLDISPQQAQDIMRLFALATVADRMAQSFYTVSFFDYTPQLFGSGDEFGALLNRVTKHDYVQPRKAIDLDEELCASIDAVTMDVSVECVCWSGYIKHTSVTWETVQIPRKVIERIAKEKPHAVLNTRSAVVQPA